MEWPSRQQHSLQGSGCQDVMIRWLDLRGLAQHGSPHEDPLYSIRTGIAEIGQASLWPPELSVTAVQRGWGVVVPAGGELPRGCWNAYVGERGEQRGALQQLLPSLFPWHRRPGAPCTGRS